MAAQGRTTRRRHHQGAGFAVSPAISVIARGSARDHGPITASKIPVKSKMARRRHPPQPRRTLKPGYPPDLQWNGLLHCPSDASQ
jgi:hypothetical protein